MPGRMLALRLDCAVDADAKGKLPVHFLTLGGGASTGQKLELAQYFALADRSQPFALAGGKALAGLANPFSFNSVWRTLSAANGELEGLTLDYEGTIAATLSVSLKEAMESDNFDLSAGATVAVSFRRKTVLSLSLRRGPKLGLGHSVLLTVSRNRLREKGITASADLTIDLSKSAEQIHAILKKGLGKWDKALETIEPYLTPGTLIRQQLEGELKKSVDKLVKDADLKAAIEADARLALGLDAGDESALSAWLVGLVTQKIDTYAGKYATKADEAVDETVTGLLADLPLIKRLGAQDKVRAEIDKLIGKARDKLKAEAKAIYDGAQTSAAKKAELGSALAKIGKQSTAAVTKLDDVLDPVRKLIDEYNTLFHKLEAEFANQARQEITASVSIELKAEKGTNFEFAGTFTDNTEDAGKLYDALLAGGYQAVEEQLRGTGSVPGFTIDLSRSAITRYSQRTQGWGYKLRLFGVGLSGAGQIISKASVTVNGNGEIVADLTGKATRNLVKPGASRSFEFLHTARIRELIEAQGNGRLSEQSVAFTMPYQEKKLTYDEVGAFLLDLANTPVRPFADGDGPRFLDMAACTQALGQFAGWIANPGSKAKVRGRITLRLSLAPEKLLARLAQPLGDSAELFEQVMQLLERNGAFRSKDWDNFVKRVGKDERRTLPAEGTGQPRQYRTMALEDYARVHGTTTGGQHGIRIDAPGHERVRQTIAQARSFVIMAQAMRSIYVLSLNGPAAQIEADGEKLERQIGKAVARIVSLGSASADTLIEVHKLFEFEDGISGRTLTFLQMLHDYFGIGKPAITVTIDRLDDSSKVVETIAL